VTLIGGGGFLNGLVGSVINGGDVTVLLGSRHVFQKSRRFEFFMVGIGGVG
jgi:hypothetical protein